MELIQALLLAVFGFIGYYLFIVVKKPEIVTGNRKLAQFLENHVGAVQQSYWPALCHWEARLQSILGLTRRVTRPGRLPYTRHLFTLSDGGELGLDFLNPQDVGLAVQDTGKRPLVLLLPGLTNSSQTSYVKTLALAVVTAGARLVVYNNRGLGGVPLKTPKTYCASNYADLREVVQFLHEKYEGEKMVVIGASLGGMQLCQYLLGQAEECKKVFSAALLISVVWDALAGIRSIERRGMNSIVNSGMAESLKGLARKHQKTLEKRDCWDFAKVLRSRTLRDFDTTFTAPQFGYSTVWDYYKDCTISERVGLFTIPVFALSALDDPMQPGKDLPLREAKAAGSNLAFILTSRGGHLGFLEGLLPTKKAFHFSERLVMDWVKALTHHLTDLTS